MPPLPTTTGVEEREEIWIPEKLKQRNVTEEQVRSALTLFHSEQSRRIRVTFGRVLTQHGIITQSDLAKLTATHYQLPVFDVTKEAVTAHTAKLIASSIARRCKAIVVGRSGDVAKVIVAEPTYRNLREIATSLSGSGLFGRRPCGNILSLHDFFVAPASDILNKLDEALTPRVTLTEVQTGRGYIDSIIRSAVQADASDIHFIPKERSLEVKYRIDGCLWTIQLVGLDRKQEVIANAKMFGKLNIGDPTQPLDGNAQLEIGSRTFKLRFSSMPSQYGQNVVVRLLDQDAAVLPFAELGMSEMDAIAVQEAMAMPYGLLFVVGPTGSGKTTTLASLVGQLNGNQYSIRTLENPIEYKLSNAVQSEVTEGMPFALGVRALLRQDPDYLLIGETRDLETLQASIEGGLTGHSCFSTIHANDGIGGIVRMLDMGADQGPMLAACHLFIAQRLVRRLCPTCKRLVEDSAEVFERFKIPHGPNDQLFEPIGCKNCRDGFRGRIGIYEVRRMKDFEQAVIKHGKGCAPACREIVAQRNMSTMLTDGFAKAVRGLTTLDEVFSQVVS